MGSPGEAILTSPDPGQIGVPEMVEREAPRVSGVYLWVPIAWVIGEGHFRCTIQGRRGQKDL